ncbi:MAG TPA: VanW family protein [Thermomicrobiales bacterium]|nr:VanW family protein [Thermomicrobiales bacterium]
MALRQPARLSNMFRPEFAGHPQSEESGAPGRLPFTAISNVRLRAVLLSAAGVAALLDLAVAVLVLTVRATYADRIFPAVAVADVPVGGMPFPSAATALSDRANAIESSPITFTHGDKSWTSTLREVGVMVDEDEALARAVGYGREKSAFHRLRAVASIAQSGEQLAIPIALDHEQLNRWFDEIDRGLGTPPRDASVEIQGSNVVIVPEVEGVVVNRDLARDEVESQLLNLKPIEAELPIHTKIANVRSVDLEPARQLVLRAMSNPVQVTSAGGLWTLPATEIARFVRQDVVPGEGGAPAVQLGLDREKLAAWLDERLAAAIETEPVDAEVGWNGERLISVEPSVDGVRLDAAKLAEQIEGMFFGNGGAIEAPVTHVKPTIDSSNLDKLGITTFLGSGQSNYSGSSDGRSTNVAVGAGLLNGALIAPWGEFSFNEAIGWIDEDKGFVEAQVIDGERIGQDIGGGICQVSTTVFRAAYLAGLPITEWWPHRFRIGFYEYDGWDPGLDASILQPTEDPATWADFKFENPSSSWMLVESWTDGVNVVVNIYGADLGYDIETTGPTWGEKSQMLPPQEVVDEELDPGTVTLEQVAGIGEELSHYRVVRGRNGELLWERSFYTKYFPRGDVWKVSADMKGKAPIDRNAEFPPLPPSGVDSMGWVPGAEAYTGEGGTAPVEEWVAPVEEWTPPVEDAGAG